MKIETRQTTFWALVDSGSVTRVKFQGKEEFHFVDGVFEGFSVLEEHPLLADYQHPCQRVFISSSADNPELVAEALFDTVVSLNSGARNPAGYFNELGTAQILRNGYGLLGELPQPFVESCCKVLASFGIRHSILEGRGSRWPRKVLIMGESFVIAEDFVVETDA